MEPITTDDVLEKIGSFGRYQFRLLMIMGLMIFAVGWQGVITSFLALEPPWRCVSNSTSCNMTGTFSPGDDGYDKRCTLDRNQWEFDLSEYDSIVSQWDLVCARTSLSSMSKSIVFAGFMVGVLVCGVLSDKFGRKPIVFFPGVLTSVFGLIASFAEVFWLFLVLRALVGLCYGASAMAIFVLMVEYVGVKHRAMAGTSLWYFFTIALCVLALMAYLIRDWRHLSIAGSAPGLLMIFLWWLIPESSRWLLTNGKKEKSREIFAQIAKMNRKELPPNPIELVAEPERIGDVRDLFRSWKTARYTLINWFCWAAISMVYWGALFSFDAFGGNVYLSFFLVAVVEIPATWMVIKTMNKWGRRKNVLATLILASIFSTAAVLLLTRVKEEPYRIATVVMSMMARFFITFAFDTIYVFTCELFPTVVRNIAIGTSSGAARIGSISAPFIVELMRVHVLVPWSIFAVLAAIACVLCFTLPETNLEPIMETFEDEEMQGKHKQNGVENPGLDNTKF